MSPMVKLPLTLEHALLGFLYQEPMHGYQVHHQLTKARDLGLVWRLKEAQLYRLLGRLEEEGLVIAESEPQPQRPTRRILHLSERGREVFLDWVRTPVQRGRELRLEFMAKLYFARQLGSDVVRELIEAQRAELNAALDEVNEQAERARDGRIYDWLVLDFRAGQLSAMLRWLDTCEEVIASEQGNR